LIRRAVYQSRRVAAGMPDGDRGQPGWFVGRNAEVNAGGTTGGDEMSPGTTKID
jgi:hypothetical protein